jgi:uncharacterized membrane protein YdjX (TVP38/TMEM64 family)
MFAIFIGISLVASLSLGISSDDFEKLVRQYHESYAHLSGPLISLFFWGDILFSIPTMLLALLSGALHGPLWGAFYVILGLNFCGLTGYVAGKVAGEKLLKLIVKDSITREELRELFVKKGSLLIIVSRGVPMFPEVCSCLSGYSGVSLGRFLLLWQLSCVPYAFILAYSGSLSTWDNPWPGLITMGIFWALLLVLGWFVQKKQ